jgi:hypothetical protein
MHHHIAAQSISFKERRFETAVVIRRRFKSPFLAVSGDPAGALVFHVGSGALRDLPAEVTLDYAQGQVRAGG